MSPLTEILEPADAPEPVAGPPVEAIDLVGILSAIEETAYTWDIAADHIEWESNAAEVLGLSDMTAIATGAAFDLLVAAEHITRRRDAILGQIAPAHGKGVPYRTQYRFTPGGRRTSKTLWLEDHGRWWPAADGRPAKARGVVRVINDRYWEEQRLLFRSDHDELTGQLNRTRLTEALGAVLSRVERSHQTCCFLMAAVNNMAHINETFGFDVGDEVIAATARLIKEKLRGGDSIGRYSSNKFGIILNDCGPAAMRIAADRFIRAVRDATIRTSACPLSSTISIGGVVLPDQARTVHQAMSHALQALDRAKLKRYDCFMAFEPSPIRETQRRRNISIADEIVSALDENRMSLVLQPIVSAQTRAPVFYECLLRLEKPDGSIVSAGDFIAVAEQLGLSRLIDRRTLELAIDVLKERIDLTVSLNVSSLTANDADWMTALQRLTAADRSVTSRLIIEITETAAIHDIDQTAAFVDTLKEMGCRVAIDDFGAGYTSFRNLKALAVDIIKIDGAFVQNLSEDSSDQVFIRTMIDLARSFGMETVAEWVCDEASAQFLLEVGVTYLQGFTYGRPMPPAEIARSG